MHILEDYLFLLDFLGTIVVSLIALACGLIFGPPVAKYCGWLLIFCAAYLIFPKRLLRDYIEIDTQPLWLMALSVVAGVGILVAGGYYVTMGQEDYDNVTHSAGVKVAEWTTKRRFLLIPYPAYKKVWTVQTYIPGPKGDNPKSPGDAFFSTILSGNGKRAFVFYDQKAYKNNKQEWLHSELDGEWGAVLDAENGKTLYARQLYFPTLQAAAFLPGNGSVMIWEGAYSGENFVRRWDEARPKDLEDRRSALQTWTDLKNPALAGKDRARIFTPLSLHAGCALAGEKTIYFPALLAASGKDHASTYLNGTLSVFGGPDRKAVANLTLDAYGDYFKAWDVSPDGSEIALAPHQYKTKEDRIEIRALPDQKVTATFDPPGSSADWLEYSADGKSLLVFNTELKLLTVLDRKNGKETGRFALYAPGDISMAGISADAQSVLLFNQDTGELSLFRR